MSAFDEVIETKSDYPLSSFGELNTIQQTPIIQQNFAYGQLNGQQIEQFTAGASITGSAGKVTMGLGDTVGFYATIRTRRQIRYRTGQGAMARFTCVFDSANAVDGTLQLAGVFSAFDGYGLGYNGSTFGIMRRYGGASEIRRLEVTTAAGGAETMTITLNGTETTVDLTNAAASKEFTAYEIANEFSLAGWTAEHEGVYVYFLNDTDGAKSGSYSVSSATAVGTFTQIKAGVSKTETWTALSNFNGDNTLSTWFDPSKGNVYQIDYQWLGFGAIRFWVEDPNTGKFTLIHTIRYANRNTTTSTMNPNFRILFAIANLTAGAALSMTVHSIAAFNQGKIRSLDPSFGFASEKLTVSGGTETSILAIKNRLVYGTLWNQAEILIRAVSVSCEGTKPCQFRFYLQNSGDIGGGTTSDYPDWQVVSASDSVALTDVNAVTASSTLVLALSTGKSDSRLIDMSNFNIILNRGAMFIVTAESSANADFSVSINWVEDH